MPVKIPSALKWSCNWKKRWRNRECVLLLVYPPRWQLIPRTQQTNTKTNTTVCCSVVEIFFVEQIVPIQITAVGGFIPDCKTTIREKMGVQCIGFALILNIKRRYNEPEKYGSLGKQTNEIIATWCCGNNLTSKQFAIDYSDHFC